ncbi:unnamed protein product [Coffea canephora]|uniref:E3 ubiquitin-protein ligase listerin n=1 Tax=Coffea canephora TaxID=49390 RepID=A0A068U6E1_COFCA|nr:unnamed protein product [Coffea canephora]
MGRPKGDGARSKSRPSSSSLAASLLPSGAAAVGFGGYVGSSRVDSSFSAEAPTVSLDIDGEVAQHLKRLSRKDPTTKLKALTSLSQLLKEKSASEVAPIIPQWAFEYKKLLLDYNRDVRRATHDTMAYLVRAVGRDLAPHLKYFLGPWWFSQFDSVYEVSLAAKRSFQAAFPAQEKRLDALILGTSEIFMYIEENLKLTPQSMSDKVTATDELEEMHKQVISSSLLALSALLDVLVCLQSERPGFENIKAEPKNASKARATAIAYAEKLFSANKYFIDFLKSKNPGVRSATYSAMRSFIKNIPHAINEENVKTLAVAILGAFQEKDPTCHSPMWETVLLFSKKFPESWTLLNVQNVILNCFWHFLKNGCFGSQQVSYPALILFLDAVPPKAIVGEKFFFDFFKNLWEGRSLSHSLTADQQAFFLALKECFLWALRNASRYCDTLDAIQHLQYALTDEVLLKLMWCEYSQFVSPKDKSAMVPGASPVSSEDTIQTSNMERTENLKMKYPVGYEQDLGKCIVEILSGVYSLENNLLSVFCSVFQNHCIEIFQQIESSGNVEVVIRFVLLLDQHVVKKGETWPLDYLVGPTLAKSFPLIKELDPPDALRFMAAVAYVFGPHKIIQELMGIELGKEQFLQAFNELFIPWCLKDWSVSTSAKLDFLLALMDSEYFTEQWNSIVTYAIYPKDSTLGTSDSKIPVLAVLMEKARERLRKANTLRGSQPEDWQHEFLDIAALSVVNANPPFGTSDARFLRALIGGETKEESSFISRNTLSLIFKEVLRKLLTFVADSTFAWVKCVCSLIPCAGKLSEVRWRSSNHVLEEANFALEVLTGSFFCLKKLDCEIEMIAGILGAIFVIDWEYNSIRTVISSELDVECMEQVKMRMPFCESVHAFRSNISCQFLKSFCLEIRKNLRSILVHMGRWAVLKEDKLDIDKITSLSCLWLLEVMECLCLDQFEEQMLLDEFLGRSDFWPLWIMPNANSQERSAVLNTDCTTIDESGNQKFVILIDKLISRIGFHRVIAGAVAHDSPTVSEEPTVNLTTSEVSYSRAWLAAEILCTWKWPGGSAFSSFLPLLSAYVISQDYSPAHGLLDSIVSILLDGALMHGESGELTPGNVWPGLYHEAESISEPFLRALIALLSTLFQKNIWGKVKAVSYFRMLREKLFIGETVNLNCLNVLPACMEVFIAPLSIASDASHKSDQPDDFIECELHVTVVDWLRKTACFPPLNTWQSGKDMEGWFQLVLSCYPVSAAKGVNCIKKQRSIDSLERGVLFELFRKQRQNFGAATLINKLPMVQVLLSKLLLVSVAYCWEDFNHDDWEFVLYRLRWWIESTVVMMEEVAESVNDAITSSSTCSDLEATLNKLMLTASNVDHSAINIARNALAAFSLFCGHLGNENNELEDNLNPLTNDRWEIMKDRIYECILRLFFSTGVAESIEGSFCSESSSFIAASRLEDSQFWELVASSVAESSSHARDKAAKSVDMWGLSKGPLDSLYAILFSSKPLPHLQFAAYTLLSSEPISHVAFISEEFKTSFDEDTSSNQGSVLPDLASEQNFRLRDEISFMFERFPREVLDMDLLACKRVNLFVIWSLLLSHLVSLPSSTSAREKMVQYMQDTADSTILDCIFQHIPLESLAGSSLKRKELPPAVSRAATAAAHAITTGSVLLSVENLWPLEAEKMTSLAGAIYGLMLCMLPAYVREWFNSIRDRSRSSMIESFTIRWCSPLLIKNELNQIKKADFADENFSVSVSKSANEVVATYTKDETGMDLVIRLPASYPLRSVDVDCTRSLGISDVKQRKWLMSMMLFVRNQNGALAESIRIWKSNFDKEFEGVEECPICYSVIHTSNHSLPRLACKTCKHKFHSACLYKWFSTSHKSTCPLCQSPF